MHGSPSAGGHRREVPIDRQRRYVPATAGGVVTSSMGDGTWPIVIICTITI